MQRNYTDVLPSVNVRWELTDQLLARAAYLSRSGPAQFRQSPPASLIERDDEGEVEAEAGNTDLDPTRADNVDFSLEYYPGSASVISAGLFYKNLVYPTAPLDFAGSPGFEGFDVFSSFINGGDAQWFGVELAIQQQLTFLPTPLDGFLMP